MACLSWAPDGTTKLSQKTSVVPEALTLLRLPAAGTGSSWAALSGGLAGWEMIRMLTGPIRFCF